MRSKPWWGSLPRLSIVVLAVAAWVPGSASSAWALEAAAAACSSRGDDNPISFSLLQTGLRRVQADGENETQPGTLGAVYARSACSMGAGIDGDSHPFQFWEQKLTKSHVPVAAVSDSTGSGLCIFPTGSCADPEAGCCRASQWVVAGSGLSEWLATCVSIAATVVIVSALQVAKRQAPNRPESVGSCRDVLNDLALLGGIIINLNAAVWMSRSVQTTLKVAERNAMLSASAFLVPLQEAFQFLEDAVSVKIGYAIGTGDAEAVTAVLMLGVFGGLVLGSFAALCASIVSWMPVVIHYMLHPGDFGTLACSVVPSMTALLETARPYWLLAAWAWPLTFAGMALTGFLLGTREYGVFFFATLLSKGILMGMWFGMVPRDLHSLGWAGLCAALVFVVTCWVAALIYPPLRQQYNWNSAKAFFNSQRALASSKSQGPAYNIIGSDALVQGAQAMVLEVCVQAAMTCTVLVARNMGADVMYQVSAMQSAMPLYGMVTAAPVGYTTRLIVSALVGRGKLDEVGPLVRFMSTVTLVVCLGIAGSIIPFRSQLAFRYAEQACMYASQPSCVPLYQGVFGGGNGTDLALRDSFLVFAFAAMSVNILTFLKSALYGCFDFEFMAKAGLLTLVTVYLPSIILACFVLKSAAAVYAAAHVPVLVLSVVFFLRLRSNISRMKRNEPGPWQCVKAASESPPEFEARLS